MRGVPVVTGLTVEQAAEGLRALDKCAGVIVSGGARYEYVELPRPCFHVWHRQWGDLNGAGVLWRCGFCLAAVFKARRPDGGIVAQGLSPLIRFKAERGAEAPLVHPATVPAPRSTP